MRCRARTLSVFAVALLPGCAFLGTSEGPSYFRPEPTSNSRTRDQVLKNVPLRVRKLRASSYLGERIVWRSSSVEVGFYDSRRWIEPPGDVVERAVQEELFNGLGMVPSAGTANALDLELCEFEEVRAPAHEAVIRLIFELTDERGRSLARQSINVRKPILRAEPAGVARAMGLALDELVETLSNDVVVGLRTR